MEKLEISLIKAKEILDSNGMPTLEVELTTDFGVFSASCPSGVSTGKYEALESRDEDGRGVSRAIDDIRKIIFPALKKEELTDQKKIDEILIQLDGTKNKSRLGANAILPISVAACRASAASVGLPLYRYIAKLTDNGSPLILPKPSFNMIEGGKHSNSGLAFQEFMVVPQKEKFRENLEIGLAIYQKLKEILENRFGKIELSKEGAFSAPLKTAFETTDSILEAAGGEDIKIAIDAAGAKGENYLELVEKYPILSIEDPFAEEDFEEFAKLKNEIGDKVLIFGDDLTATNVERMKMVKEKDLCNGVIIKPNQIGTITETLEAAKLAKSYGWKIMVANRAGETEDDFIADLAVGIGAEFIKSGAPFPKERMAKYNRLAKIEEELYV